MILGQDDGPSLEDAMLMHYGKKGMKWGVRNKKPTALQIRSARVEVDNRLADLKVKRVAIANASSTTAQKKAQKDFDKALFELNTSDANIHALRYTNGEKAALILLTGPLAAIPLAASAGSQKYVAKQVDKARAAGK